MDVKISFDVLSHKLIDKIKKYPATADILKTNLTDWDPNLIGTSGVILLYYLKDELLEEVKMEIIKKFPKLAECKFSVAYTLGSRLSYIQWHCDQGHKYAITLYLNEHWNRDWSGALVYQDADNNYRAVYPEYNKAISFTPPVWHTTTMPTILAPLRESLQIFCDEYGN
jgi:Rps23 Pro-64 3,4-dihydroxylase Tpa1-like proline 4-hydroxylase